MSYNLTDIEAMRLEEWRGDDFSVLTYPPKGTQQWEGVNDTTRLVLNFKEAAAPAMSLVSEIVVEAVGRHAARFREGVGTGYVMAAPRSGAGVRNYGCEAVAKALATTYPYLQHLPGALVRTTSLTPAPSEEGTPSRSTSTRCATQAQPSGRT